MPLARCVAVALFSAAVSCVATVAPRPPADFSPSPYLPELLRFDNGSAVTTAAQWTARREEIKGLIQTYLTGTLPTSQAKLEAHRNINSTSVGRATSVVDEVTFTLEGCSVTFPVRSPPQPKSDGNPPGCGGHLPAVSVARATFLPTVALACF